MSERVVRALGEGLGGPEAIQLLQRSQRSKILLLVRLAAELAGPADHGEAAQIGHAYRLLKRLMEGAPETADRVLRSPSVGACALATVGRLRGEPTDWPSFDRLASLMKSTASRAPAKAWLQVGDESLAIEIFLAQPESGYFPGVEIDRTLCDDAARVAVWRRRLATGCQILLRHHRSVAEEVAAIMTTLVPLTDPPSGHNSGTFRHAFGLVAMSLPPDGTAAALTLAHEVQHAKLAALMDLFPMVADRPEISCYTPWRPDPRPLPAALQGAYAHLGVTGFWRTQRWHEKEPSKAHQAEVEFARWRSGTAQAVRVLLGSGHLTAVGRVFVMAMSDQLARWSAESVSARAGAAAARLAVEHRLAWLQRNGSDAGVGSRRSSL